MGGQLIEGKGVSRTNGFAVPALMLTVVGIDTPHRSQAEHRLYDRRVHIPMPHGHADIGDDHPHVLSMMEFGVQMPVIVEVEEVNGKDVYLVAEGRGRVMKMRIADRLNKARGRESKPVPCIARRVNPTVAKLDLSLGIILNEHRVDDSAINRAQKAQYLLSTGESAEYVARLFGVSELTIGEWMKLVEMPAVAQNAVETGKASATAVVKLHGMPKEKLAEELGKLVAGANGKMVTVRAATAAAKGVKNGSPDAIVPPTKRQLRRAIEGGKGVLSDDMILAFRIVLGDVGPAKVKNLMALMRGEDAAAE